MRIKPKINMITGTFSLGYKINLRRIAQWTGATYKPRTFRGMILQPASKEWAVIIYPTSTGIATGFKSTRAAMAVLRELLSFLRIDSSKIKLRVVNMTASARIHRKIDLYKLTSAIGGSYIPGIFPNMQYRLTDPKVTVIISGDGGLSFIGAKSKKELMAAARKMEKLFEKHKEVFI